MTAPSIKEALTNIAAISACVAVVDNPTSHVEMLSKINAISVGALKALATFQPDGERREAIARAQAVADRIRWLLQDEPGSLSFALEMHSKAHEIMGAIDALLASGFVPDEADIRADEREKCAKIADREAEFWQDAESSSARIVAANIRSARDGGAET